MYREEIPYTEVVTSTNQDQRRGYWETACGLQEVDGLEVSGYTRDLGESYVVGKISSSELASTVSKEYSDYAAPEARGSAEADLAASRIPGLLESRAFKLEPRQLYVIHGALFDGVFRRDWVGRQRTQNLEKAEPVLGGRSVVYADHTQIAAQLDYDFEQERAAAHKAPIGAAELAGVTRFIANVWQTHPFREGNTRTTAVFLELYLNALGCTVDNEPFARHSTYFRDALVRASYSSIQEDIPEDISYLKRFLENVVLGARHDLAKDDLNVRGIRVIDDLSYRDAKQEH